MGDLVYGASCSGTLFAFDRFSGEVRWSYDTLQDGATAQFHGDPIVTDELLVIPSDASPAGFVYAFELETGTVRWKTPVAPGGITSHLLRHGSTILGLTQNGTLYAFDLATGAERWSVEPDSESRGMTLNNHPALAGERVYFGAADGRVRAVSVISGEVLWATDLGARPNTQAVVHGRDLVVGTMDRKLHRLALADGSRTGELELPEVPVGTPALFEESMIQVLGSGQLVSVARDLGEIRWSYSSPSNWTSFQPLAEGEQVVAGTDDGDLFAFSVADGRIAWRDKVDGTVRGIGESEGTYYIGTLQGALYAYSRASDGTPEPAAPDALSWLAGNWRGEKRGGLIEEIWSEREGGDRMGMFRLVKDGVVQFYEFMSIGYDEADGPVLRIKHFSKGLLGWEEKDDSEVFYFVRSTPREAVFAQRESEVPTRLVYRLTDDGELVILLEKDREAGTSTSEFRFSRQ